MKTNVTIKQADKQASIYVHHVTVNSRGEKKTMWLDTPDGRQEVTYTVAGEEKFDGMVFGIRQKPENATPQGQRNWLSSVGCKEEIIATDAIKIVPVGSFIANIPDSEFMGLASVQAAIEAFKKSRPDLFNK